VKTIIEIPDELYERAKASAELEGRSLPELVIESLRIRLESRPRKRVKFPIIPSERKDKVNLTRAQVDEAVLG
jgi:hypothetical protein